MSAEDECTCDNEHTTRLFVQQMTPTSSIGLTTDTLGMWLLDMAKELNLVTEGGVYVEMFDTDDLVLPPPDGWSAYNIVVDVHEAFDVEV